jgi:hypothetical protein
MNVFLHRNRVGVASRVVLNPNSYVLVEGPSDRNAVMALAARLGRDLDREGVSVVALGGATALGPFLEDLLPTNARIAGLCDEGEADEYRRALGRAGLGAPMTTLDMEALGFYVCVRDLEDEMIRSLGTQRILEIFEADGEMSTFAKFQNQPAWRGRDLADQVHRFLGIRSGRKARYGRLLGEALDLDRVPPPLSGVLSHV